MTIAQRNMTATEQSSEYAFSDADFSTIAELANRKYGLYLQSSKKALVYSRLARRLRALHLTRFSDYCKLLDTPEGETEQSHLLSALTTNVTHFFREKHHFDQLRKDILPGLMEKARHGGAVRLWSSACSAGQEAYCIAAMILDGCKDARTRDIKILATDVDPAIIEKARAGIYPDDQLDAIPAALHSLMVDRTGAPSGYFAMRSELRALISFGQLNLIDAWPMKRQFDVIFCRNAAIYFDKQTQARLWARFAETLVPDGYLMIGHSERISGEASRVFRTAGVTTYQKTRAADEHLKLTSKKE